MDRYRENIAGDDLMEKMKEGIREADKFLICISPSFNSKPPTSYVKQELKTAMLEENKSSNNKLIIPIRIKKGGRIPKEIGRKAYADLSTKERWEKNISRLIEAIIK